MYKSKLRELKRASRAVFKRVTETQLRPKLLNNLNTSLNVSRDFLNRMKNLSGELQIFTDVEMTTLETLIEETEVSLSLSFSLSLLSSLSLSLSLSLFLSLTHTHTHFPLSLSPGVDGQDDSPARSHSSIWRACATRQWHWRADQESRPWNPLPSQQAKKPSTSKG